MSAGPLRDRFIRHLRVAHDLTCDESQDRLDAIIAAAHADAQPRLVASDVGDALFAVFGWPSRPFNGAGRYVPSRPFPAGIQSGDRDNPAWDAAAARFIAALAAATEASAGAVERCDGCGEDEDHVSHRTEYRDVTFHTFQRATPPTRCAAHGQDHSNGCPAEGAG